MVPSDEGSRRETLRAIEDKILQTTGNRYEQLVFVAPDGRVLFAKDGPRDHVCISRGEVARLRGKVDLATHNHPIGYPLSVDDVLTARLLDVREVNAFTPVIRYRLFAKPGRAWPERTTLQHILRRLEARAVHLIQAAAYLGRLTPADVLVLYRQAVWHAVARIYASDVDYIVEER